SRRSVPANRTHTSRELALVLDRRTSARIRQDNECDRRSRSARLQQDRIARTVPVQNGGTACVLLWRPCHSPRCLNSLVGVLSSWILLRPGDLVRIQELCWAVRRAQPGRKRQLR